jgi:hypothetical protein
MTAAATRRDELIADGRRLAAELEVLEAYDRARGERPFDMTASRRNRVIVRRYRALHELTRIIVACDLRYHGDEVARELELDAETDEDLELLNAALARDARRRLGRWDVSEAVVQSVKAAADHIGLDYPPILHDHLDGRAKIHPTGGYRARR